MNRSKSYRLANYRLMAFICGALLLVLAAAMLLPLVVSLIVDDGALPALLVSEAVNIVLGCLLYFLAGHRHDNELLGRESFWTTAFAWILVPLAGAVPFMLPPLSLSPADAIFESVSGFTTTGSSVLSSPESLPLSLLLWRHISQWLGGLGLMLIIVALHRNLRVGSLRLYDAEFSGTVQRKLHPRIATSVSYMWQVYLILTVVLFAGLLACGNGLRTSFCLALSAVSTGGFLPSADALASANVPSLVLIGLFMWFSGVNVALLHHLFHGRVSTLFRDDEFRTYSAVSLFAALACFLALSFSDGNSWHSLGYCFFHVSSTISTCGLVLDNSVAWPPLVGVVTFLLVILGASSGSTGGGIKVKRIMILRRYVNNYISRMLHPNVVFSVRLNGVSLSGDYVAKVFAFLFLYVLFVVAGGGVLALCGCDIPTALTVAAANIANLGPTPLINSLSPLFSYAALPLAAKVSLMVLMIAGRIEIFALLALFSPAYWHKR